MKIGHFLLDPSSKVCVRFKLPLDVIVAEPLQFGQQFPHLAGQSHCYVFRGVELFPVTLPGEVAEVLLQEFLRSAHVGHTSPL